MKERSEGERFCTPIGPVVEKILAGAGLKELVQASRIFQLWVEVVGPDIARHAQPQTFHKGILTVNVDSSVWLAQLDRYFKERIREKVNRKLGSPLVKKVIFKVGEIQPPGE